MPLNLDDGEWIPVFRKIRDNWVWRDPAELRAWLDILMMANYHDGPFKFRGRLYPIKRGQVATTYLSLAKRNGWSRNRIRHFIELLRHDNAVTISYHFWDRKTDSWVDSRSDRGFMLLTVINYPLSKDPIEKRTAEETAEETAEWAGNVPAGGQLEDTSKKVIRGKIGRAPYLRAVEAPRFRNGSAIAEARRLADVQQDEGVRRVLLEYIGMQEAIKKASTDQVLEFVRLLLNVREGLKLYDVPTDRIFQHGLEEAIRYKAYRPTYVTEAIKEAVVKWREGALKF